MFWHLWDRRSRRRAKQLAAIGVGRIMLTNAERVERNYFDTHVLSPECYRPLLIEGLQQAQDTRLPQVSVHRRLKVLVEDELEALCGGAARVFADPAADTSIASSSVPGRGERRLLLAIGPEGGWSRFEANLLQAHGFQPAGMGPRTLRTDTACIALLALAQGRFAGCVTAFELISGVGLDFLAETLPAIRQPLPGAPWSVLLELSLPEGLAPDAALTGLLEQAMGERRGEPRHLALAPSLVVRASTGSRVSRPSDVPPR